MKCYLFLLQSLLCRVDILLYSHVDELILGFGLDHAGSLLTHSLDGFWDVNVTVQPYTETHQEEIYPHHLSALTVTYQIQRLNINSIPCLFMISIRMSITIIVPVLPIPALQSKAKQIR